MTFVPWVSERRLCAATRVDPLVLHAWGRPMYTACGRDLTENMIQVGHDIAGALKRTGMARDCEVCS